MSGTIAAGLEKTEAAAAAEPALALVGELIDFARDVKPILTEKCLSCHGPEEATNDMRVDDAESLLAYIEPHDLEGSSLWTDYLTVDDPEMRMPPPGEDATKALTGMQLASLKLWIEEGAKWDEEVAVEAAASPPKPASLVGRLWAFLGVFHPATVHFPVALLTVSAGFVLLSFIWRETCEAVAYHCLWIGALGAIVAATAGWSYAIHEGYVGFSFDLQNSTIDRHRWLGITVAVLSVILVPMANSVRRTKDIGMRLMWLLGSLLMVTAVSIAGYQGGELTYGEEHYEREFERLFPEYADKQAPEAENEAEKDNGDDDGDDNGDDNGDDDAADGAMTDDAVESVVTEPGAPEIADEPASQENTEPSGPAAEEKDSAADVEGTDKVPAADTQESDTVDSSELPE